MAVVGAFLFACAVLLFVGCAGGRSEAPEEQGHTEATNEQARSPEATTEEAQCEGTRTIKRPWGLVTTNDVPGCPDKGGLLSGTDEADELNGKQGEDEIHGLGGVDVIMGGDGNDIIYGGPGDDSPLWGERGADVSYGGDGNDGDLGGHDPGDDVIYGGMATISLTHSGTGGSGISSIAVKVGTNTLPTRTTTWTAVARSRQRL